MAGLGNRQRLAAKPLSMKRRAAFALVAALAAIVIIAVLVTGALFASNQETHAVSAEVLDQQASAYAERSALLAIAGWECPECDGLQAGEVIIRSPAPAPPLESTVYITRLDSALFLVTGEGRIMRAGAPRLRRRISIVVSTSRDTLGVPRAARVSGDAWAANYQM
jgi:hypothetical protein